MNYPFKTICCIISSPCHLCNLEYDKVELRRLTRQCCLRVRAEPSAPSMLIFSGLNLIPRSSSCLRFAPAVTDTHARLGYSLPARFERRAFHPLGKHTAFRTHSRISHQNARKAMNNASNQTLAVIKLNTSCHHYAMRFFPGSFRPARPNGLQADK